MKPTRTKIDQVNVTLFAKQCLKNIFTSFNYSRVLMNIALSIVVERAEQEPTIIDEASLLMVVNND